MSTEKPKSLFPVTIVLLRAACLALALAAPGAGASALLDGRAFVGPTGLRGEPAKRTDERVEFTDGRFRSSICEELGFRPGSYRSEPEGDAVRFESTLASEKDGTIHWTGVVRGDRIEATYTWTKEGMLWTTRREYWFEGTPTGR
jgi:hypothetical protein